MICKKIDPEMECFLMLIFFPLFVVITIAIFNCVANFVDEEIKTERYMACLEAKIGIEKCAEILKPACKEERG